jgi:hypothetical protein
MAKSNDKKEVREVLAQAEAVEAAIREAVREALLQHKRARNPVAFWENGRVVWVPPEEIPVEDEPAVP